jgi:hypothetical protein
MSTKKCNVHLKIKLLLTQNQDVNKLYNPFKFQYEPILLDIEKTGNKRVQQFAKWLDVGFTCVKKETSSKFLSPAFRVLQFNLRNFCLMLLLCLTMGRIPLGAQEVKAPLSERATLNKKDSFDRGASNIRLGNLDFVVSAGLSQQYVDNIGLSQTNPEDDFITIPSLNIGASWALSQLNGINMNIGLSWLKYWKHPELDSSSVLVAPNSKTSFNFYLWDVHFEAYTGLTISQDPISVSQLSNVTTFKHLSQQSGLNADWDLNKIILNGGYHYATHSELEERFSFYGHATHSFNASAAVKITEPTTVGVQTSYGFTDYEEEIQNNSNTYSWGVFANSTLSTYLRGNASVSFQTATFDNNGTIGDNNDFNSIIYSLGLQNQLNRWVNHSVEMRRFITLGIGSNFTDITELSYQSSIDLLRNISTSFGCNYQWLEDSQSITSEKATHLSFSIQLGYQLAETTGLGLGYTFTSKDSERIGNSYDQNRVSINLSHQF